MGLLPREQNRLWWPICPLVWGAGSGSVGELREVAAGIPVLPPHEDDDDGGGDKGEED